MRAVSFSNARRFRNEWNLSGASQTRRSPFFRGFSRRNSSRSNGPKGRALPTNLSLLRIWSRAASQDSSVEENIRNCELAAWRPLLRPYSWRTLCISLFGASAVGVALAQGAQAIPGEAVAGLVSSAVPESISNGVSSVVAPVAERTAAIIPGLIGDSPVREGIVSGFLLILFSELGDKTFFLALLLALKANKGVIFAGTFGALGVMTVISVALGQVLHQIDELGFGSSKLPLDDILACALLVFFGIKTIQDASAEGNTADGEREEAEEEVSRFDQGATGLLLSTFFLVFAAEWGDKSFLATIALAAASSPLGVVIGAIAGHGVATGIAVVGGSYLGKYLDEKVVQYCGGSLFLIFAAATAIDIVRGV